MTSRGIALVSVLLSLLVSLVLVATLFFTWFVDAQAMANVAAGDDALHVAEAGMHHLWSILEPARDFARELAWANGEPPFGTIVGFPEPPRTYRVRVAPASGRKLSVVSRGTSRRGTRRAVEAIFARGPFRPPATMIVAEGTSVGELSGAVDASLAGTTVEIPAIAGETRAEASALRAAGGAFGSAVIVGPSGFAGALAALRDAADQTLAGPQSGGDWGSDANPLVTRIVGDADMTGSIHAVGIVLVDAPLRIDGGLSVRGLLLAPAGIDVRGSLVVEGALWIGSSLAISPAGALELLDSLDALAEAASVGHGALPLPATLAAWREVW
jgi:hypothetical protein